MALAHGKRTQITAAGADISPWCKNSEFTRTADEHNVDGYGVDDHEFGGDGIRGGEFVADGTYNNDETTGPCNVLDPAVGTLMVLTRKTEGTGTGKPLQTFTGLLTEYKETNPVADYVKWAAKWKVSGEVVKTEQA